MMEDDLPKPIFFNWKKVLYYALPALVVFGVVLVKIGSKKGRAEADYVAAHHAFLKWDQILEKNGEDFVNLQTLMQKHPELHTYYDSKIAHNLIALRDAKEAAPYVERTVKRTKQPYYSDYAQTSLKISGGYYTDALQEALLLKENLLKDENVWVKGENASSLFAFNLMRIATLYQELEDTPGELKAWQEIKHYGGWSESSPAAEKIRQAGFQQLLSHFTVQETNLLDYIQAREEEIGKL